ncbi:MAG: energy transducer TonB, partial [Candidatus Omnitrophica bacterium]|nr:energy transducer TonB [Candidatus Omnitrophota bacterium]
SIIIHFSFILAEKLIPTDVLFTVEQAPNSVQVDIVEEILPKPKPLVKPEKIVKEPVIEEKVIKEPQETIQKEEKVEIVEPEEVIVTEEKVSREVVERVEAAKPKEEINPVQEEILQQEVSLEGVIIEPQELEFINKDPKYPRLAQKRGWEGNVLLKVLVSEKGFVDDIEMLESSGYDLLDKRALEELRKWRFVPTKQAGITISRWKEITVEFKLEDE